ncbi:glycosyltransferase family 2 protein [Agromyces subbeticus]|uniref:glycosyltransferase family 2 protein n=1 Tax=Agromyces subbeticus TaxID=293890 RepID=UPI0012EC6267|nr:glycosyltransferase family A protein [Agromyces subbeticus]
MPDVVSVIMPTYNRLHVLARAMDSVLEQTAAVLELIVVDDGSTDGSVEYLRHRASADPRIKVIETAHAGAAAARNRGIEAAGGEFIAFQDSDDEWHPDFIERLLPHVRGRSDLVAFVSHSVRFRDGSQMVVPRSAIERPERELLYRSVASTQTLLIPSVLLRDGAFDPALRRFQDWDLCLSLLERGGVTFRHVPVIAATLYRLDDSISEGSTKLRSASLRRILRRHRPLFRRHPLALARLLVRAYLRPGIGSRSTAVDRSPEAAGLRDLGAL